MYDNLVKRIINNGGKIKPLLVPFEESKGTGQMNPSLFLEGEKIHINLRGVQYVLFHSEDDHTFQSRYGPLVYMNPETDRSLTTTNFYMELDKDLEPVQIKKVDTNKLDAKPVWEFIGLEDARLVKWDNKWYMCGVRRDTKPDGEGRMEMSEIKFTNKGVKEVRRVRIEPPKPSYCEKNWMPILDQPYNFVKWSNPTEVVKVDLKKGKATTVHQGKDYLEGVRDFRGGSPVIPYGDNYMAIIHEVDLYKDELGRKDGQYYHRFVIWDKDWNIIHTSDVFNFMAAKIEFCCGLAIKDDKMLITFGYQDNAAFILEAPLKFMEGFIYA